MGSRPLTMAASRALIFGRINPRNFSFLAARHNNKVKYLEIHMPSGASYWKANLNLTRKTKNQPMKRSLLQTSAILLAALLANTALADDNTAKSEKKAPATSKVAQDLSGKLVAAPNGAKELSSYEIKGSPEFYVFYHSASW